MTGNSDSGTGAEPDVADPDVVWADEIFRMMQQVTTESAQTLVREGPPADVAAAERRARAAGVVARTARAILALKAFARTLNRKRVTRTDEEEMSDQDREISDAELDGLRSEFFARLDRLVSGLERKGEAEGVDRKPAARGAVAGAGAGAATAAQPEPEPGLAA